jgi:hypothetical protein
MSLDINFNKSIPSEEIEQKTTIKLVEKNGSKFLEDQYGNVVFFKGYGITIYGNSRNPTKILDELINTFDIMFLDDDAMDKYYHEPDKYNNSYLYIETMIKYGYILDSDGKIKIPKRNISEYLPFNFT